MTKLDSAEDILLYAAAREVEANVFYNLLSQFVDDPQVRALCSELASEELEHKALIELELMKLGKVVKPLTASDIKKSTTPKPLDLMLAMAKTLQMDLERILLMAMEKEKNSFKLYLDLMTVVQDPDSRKVIVELAEEEARHKIRFEMEYDRLIASRNRPPEQNSSAG
jgi:rubrerythrin